jgi:hypothetical protein
MPIPFAPLVGLALGAALAWIAAPEISRDDGPIALSRPFAVVLAFALLVWLPVVGYFVAFHGDWAYLYAVPCQRVPSAIDMALVLFAAGAVVGGFCLAVPTVRKRRFGPVITLLVVPGAVSVAALIVAARRLAVSGSFAQFHGDFGTEPIAASTLGRGVLFMGVVLALGIAWTVRALLRMAATG